MANKRLALHAYVTPETHRAWSAFAEEHGVSMSSVFEALGERLAATPAGEHLDGFGPDLVAVARQIDTMRRKRRGPHAR